MLNLVNHTPESKEKQLWSIVGRLDEAAFVNDSLWVAAQEVLDNLPAETPLMKAYIALIDVVRQRDAEMQKTIHDELTKVACELLEKEKVAA